ncbi:MAG: DEAD/DEAH box helicase family protein [Campylobacterales bacterium]|nr:DEAD/DEAH box helicase family protein [Campylobacterales bacterium]
MSNYHLLEHQQNALTKVFDNYKSGNSLSLIIMPAGSGKTLLSTHILKKFYKDYSLKSMAYISSRKTLQIQFGYDISKFTPSLKEVVKSFTYKGVIEEIRNSTINKSQFQVLIFDDVDERNITNEVQLKEIFEYFNGQKICFARSELPKSETFSNILNQNIVFKYTYKEAIKDGNFSAFQKIISNNLIQDFKDEVEDINIGAVWSLDFKKNILNRIKLLEEENIESEKSRKLIKANNIDTSEIEEMGYKKKQLKEFTKLLNDNEYFDNQAKEKNGEEHVWQTFFENNQWIFGFGLNFIFNTSLKGERLEQTVAGYSVKGHGKRTDALLKTMGLFKHYALVK